MSDISAAIGRIQSIQSGIAQITSAAQPGFQAILSQAMTPPAAAPAAATAPAPAYQARPVTAGGGTSLFVDIAKAQAGKTYIYGAEADGKADPTAFDCSELIQWSLEQMGIDFVDGSANQIAAATPISVQEALRTPGALLYRPGHIAISLGNGQTIEARGSDYGVGVFSAHDRGWTAGGLIPQLG